VRVVNEDGAQDSAVAASLWIVDPTLHDAAGSESVSVWVAYGE
jgi:hypothetical protein